MGRDRVVRVIEKGILDALGNDDRSGKMHDRPDAVSREDPLDERPIGDRPFVERHLLRHDLAGAVGQVVDDHHWPTRVHQGEDGMASDVAGAAGNEDRELRHQEAG